MLSAFFPTPLDRCVWSMIIILWEASYFKHSNNISTEKASFPHWFQQKWKPYKPYLGNKEQRWLFLVVFLSDVLTDFESASRFLHARSGKQIKLCTQKIGRVEVNLSSPVLAWGDTNLGNDRWTKVVLFTALILPMNIC